LRILDFGLDQVAQQALEFASFFDPTGPYRGHQYH
jgi:hypothetical protein